MTKKVVPCYKRTEPCKQLTWNNFGNCVCFIYKKEFIQNKISVCDRSVINMRSMCLGSSVLFLWQIVWRILASIWCQPNNSCKKHEIVNFLSHNMLTVTFFLKKDYKESSIFHINEVLLQRYWRTYSLIWSVC